MRWLNRLLKSVATLVGLKLIRWGEKTRVCEAGEGRAIVRLDPGEWAIITARSYTERTMPEAGQASQKVTERQVSADN